MWSNIIWMRSSNIWHQNCTNHAYTSFRSGKGEPLLHYLNMYNFLKPFWYTLFYLQPSEISLDKHQRAKVYTYGSRYMFIWCSRVLKCSINDENSWQVNWYTRSFDEENCDMSSFHISKIYIFKLRWSAQTLDWQHPKAFGDKTSFKN